MPKNAVLQQALTDVRPAAAETDGLVLPLNFLKLEQTMKQIVLVMACLTLATSGMTAAEPLRIRGANFGNWFLAGEDTAFRVESGNCPDNATVTVRILNSSGGEVLSEKMSGREFLKSGWRTKIEEPGFYEAEFQIDGETVAETFCAEVKREAPQDRSRRIIAAREMIPVMRHGFIVAPEKTRPAAKISPVFSASPHMEFFSQALPLARLVGFHSLRLHHFPWCVIEPEKGKFDWRYPDAAMRVARENGFPPANIIVNTFNTPRWASPHPEEDWFDNCITVWGCYAPKNFNDWANYLTELMNRYPGLKAVELMNEPNFPGFSCFWHDTPERYQELMRTGYEAVKSASPRTAVWLSGGINSIFYENFLRNGGGGYFDILPVHGPQNPGEYRSAERLTGTPHKPIVNSEWHACLLVPGRSAPYPSDRALAKKMMIDFLTQIHAGIEEICLFSIMNIWNSERESLTFYEKHKHLVSHVSGLFRRAPYAQPRYMAASWHTLSRLIRGKPGIGSGYSFSAAGVQQNAQRIESDSGTLLFVWNTGREPVPVHEELLKAARNCEVLRADGSRVSDWAKEMLAPDIYYIVLSPDIGTVAEWKNTVELLKYPDSRNLLDRTWQSHYVVTPLFDARMKPHGKPEMTAISTRVIFDPSVKPGVIDAKFALGISGGKLDLLVQVKDEIHVSGQAGKAPWEVDSVQFGIDTRNRGLRSDQVEFVASMERDQRAVLRKVVSPAIGGDLPTRYTPPEKVPGAELRHGECRIERRGNLTEYRIRLDLVELYPLVFRPGDSLRFSILVNNNNGDGRSAYWEWSSGIGGDKAPEKYGTLTPSTGKKILMKQDDLTLKSWKKDYDLTPGKIVRVDTRNALAASVGTWPKTVVPGGCYRIRFTARGSASALICKASGKTLPMFDATPQSPLSEEWRTFEYRLTIPAGATDCALSFLAWNRRGKWFEIKDFSVIGE